VLRALVSEHTPQRPNEENLVEEPLTALLRSGAQRLLQQAVEAELGELLMQYAGHTDRAGHLSAYA
jgi:hypothetical protein